MNYYQARELKGPDGKGTGKWHYTVSNKRTGTMPVGYCADGCPGHDTPEGAYEHQTAYLLDHRTNYDGLMTDMLFRCEICGAWTDRYATIDDRRFNLCDEHRNREQVAKLFGTVGDATSSW